MDRQWDISLFTSTRIVFHALLKTLWGGLRDVGAPRRDDGTARFSHVRAYAIVDILTGGATHVVNRRTIKFIC